METNLKTPDARMLQLMEWAKDHGKASTDREYFAAIGFNQANFSNVKSGHQVFTRDQIAAACKLTGANMNWIHGLESNMMRGPAKSTIEALEEATAAVKAEMAEVAKRAAKESIQYSPQ